MSEFLTELKKDRKFYGTTIHTASTTVEQRFPREVSTAMEPVWIGLYYVRSMQDFLATWSLL
jgi:hypothetical protein